MVDGDGNPLAWQKQKFQAGFNYQQFIDADTKALLDQAGRIRHPRLERHSVDLTATNAPAGLSVYKRTTSFAEAEQPPLGLAQYLYERLSVLGYSGEYVRIQSECDGAVRMGDLLNVTGGVPEWANMDAIVQRVEEDIDNGQTAIQFGVAPGLSLGRIVELLRNARTRVRWSDPVEQSAGDFADANSIEFGRVTADSNSVPGLKTATYYAVKDDTRKILMDAGADHQLRIEKSDSAGQYIQGQLDATNAILNLLGAGGSILLRTTDCMVQGQGQSQPTPRTVRIQAVRSCDPSDPPGSSWVRLVPCSDRIRIA
jgi:hypothetical protein